MKPEICPNPCVRTAHIHLQNQIVPCPYLSELAFLDLQDVGTGTSMAGSSAVVMSVKQPDFFLRFYAHVVGWTVQLSSYDQKVR